MSSRIWPPPTQAEEAASAAASIAFANGNHVDIDEDECDDGHDTCDICENCLTCDCCQCPSVYVKYHTTVTVEVDWEGDLIGVWVGTSIGDPYDVEYEDGNTVPHGKLRDRALKATAEREWPGWGFNG